MVTVVLPGGPAAVGLAKALPWRDGPRLLAALVFDAQAPLSANQRAVLLALAAQMQEAGVMDKVAMSRRMITAATGLDDQVVKGVLAALCDMGVLYLYRHGRSLDDGKPPRANIYGIEYGCARYTAEDWAAVAQRAGPPDG